MSQVFKRSAGFTLVELMLSMGFITVLLLAIAMTTMQISRIYSKGLAMKEVNQVGRTIGEDLGRTIRSSEPMTNYAANYIPQSTNPAGNITSENGSGRLCLGTYSYIWNLGAQIRANPSDTSANRYKDGAATDKLIRFVKVRDIGRTWCQRLASGALPRTESSLNHADVTELLGAGNSNLALQSLVFQLPNFAPNSEQSLFSFIYVIGTNDSELLTANGCSVQVGYTEYCSINTFTVTARASNRPIE